MAFPPEGFIIGAQKAGTTSLASLLAAQPTITLSQPKEARYFSENWERGNDWYRERFTGPEGSIFVDASPGYAAAPTRAFPKEIHSNDPRKQVPARLFGVNPNARFVYLLRNPVERTYSAYWHDARAGRLKSSFRDAISSNPIYLRTSDYAGQIRNYLDYFGIERFLLLDFAEFKGEPDRVAARCCEFFGASYDALPGNPESRRKNKGYQLSGIAKVAHMVSGSDENFKKLANSIRAVAPKPLVNFLTRVAVREVPPMLPKDRRYVRAVLRESMDELEELTGFDVSRWH